MIPKSQIKDIPIYQPGKPIEDVKRELGLNKVVKLASNENPYGASPQVNQALLAEMDHLAYYPDAASLKLREGLSHLYQLEADEVIFGNGSDEIIQLITRAYLDHQSSTVMATPTFPIYKTNAEIEGAKCIEVPLVNGVHNLEKMRESIEPNTRVMWLCNPNNPTGTYVNQQDFEAFMQRIPKDILVVVDEAYFEYVSASDYPDTVALLKRYNNLIILRTFSKIYGLASLRIGYGLAHRQVIQVLNKVRLPFNTSRFAQAAALAALQDQLYVEKCKMENLAGIKLLEHFCETNRLSFYPTQANFMLIDTHLPAQEVFDQLLGQGYIVRSGLALGFPTSIRVTIGTEEQMQGLTTALTKILARASLT